MPSNEPRMSTSFENISDQAGAAAGQAGRLASHSIDRAGEALENARDFGLHAATSARRTVESYPWHSAGIALAVGVIAGMLLDRLFRD